MEDLRSAVRAFLTRDLGITAVAGFDDTSSLIATDVLDSTAVMELATFLQANYGIEVRDDELVPENLDSIAAIAAFAQRKRASAAA